MLNQEMKNTYPLRVIAHGMERTLKMTAMMGMRLMDIPLVRSVETIGAVRANRLARRTMVHTRLSYHRRAKWDTKPRVNHTGMGA